MIAVTTAQAAPVGAEQPADAAQRYLAGLRLFRRGDGPATAAVRISVRLSGCQRATPFLYDY